MRVSECRASSAAARAFVGSLLIPTLHKPDLKTFLAFRERSPDSPVLITGALQPWKLKQWTPDKLRCLDVQVPLEMSKGGADYRDAFRDDVNENGVTHIQRESNPNRAFIAGHLSSLKSFCDTFLMPSSKTYSTTAYLAQYDLVSKVPELNEACGETPAFLCEGGLGENNKFMRNTWLGPRDTVTPLHREPYHNLFCQAWGVKRLLLYPSTEPDSTMCAFPKTNGFLKNTSMIDPECLQSIDTQENGAEFLMMARTRGFQVELKSGEALFLPKGTWHHVRSLEPSLSISYWWEDRIGR